MTAKFSVYRLIDPAQPWHYRYVGKTKRALKKRLRGHIEQAKNLKVDWLRTLLFADPFRHPIIEIIASAETEEEAFELEKDYIEKYRAEGHELTNTTAVGNKGKKHSAETKAKMSATHKKRCENPKVRVEMGIISKERWKDPKYQAKMKFNHKGMGGKKHSVKTRLKMRITALKNALKREMRKVK